MPTIDCIRKTGQTACVVTHRISFFSVWSQILSFVGGPLAKAVKPWLIQKWTKGQNKQAWSLGRSPFFSYHNLATFFSLAHAILCCQLVLSYIHSDWICLPILISDVATKTTFEMSITGAETRTARTQIKHQWDPCETNAWLIDYSLWVPGWGKGGHPERLSPTCLFQLLQGQVT